MYCLASYRAGVAVAQRRFKFVIDHCPLLSLLCGYSVSRNQMLCSQVLGHCGHPCGRFFACLLVTAMNRREVSEWYCCREASRGGRTPMRVYLSLNSRFLVSCAEMRR